MKLKNIGLSLAVISALGLGITGCGSSSSDTPGATTETGIFVDAPVQGLKYITATQSGYTNGKGEFKYVAGETIEFKLGNLSLGNKVGSTLMTPYTLGDSNTTSPSTKTTNIAMLLQTLDANRSNGNILDLSKLKDFIFSNIDLTSSVNDMENTIIPNIVSAVTSHANFGANFLDINTTVVSATSANSNMKISVLESITITHLDKVYKNIISKHTKKIWLDRNLGASQACTSFNDEACYGDYYQWGRETDGHEKSNSSLSSIRATSVSNIGNKDFIVASIDWTTADSNGDIRKLNWNPCPYGYRIPTIAELVDEGISNRDDAYIKLKLPSAGYRLYDSGLLDSQGIYGRVWSSSVYEYNSKYFAFGLDYASGPQRNRSYGRSVRCIKN